MTTSSTPVRIVEETPAYWRALFDNPPSTSSTAACSRASQSLLSRMDASPDLRVVVFESANPEFYLAHFDMTGKSASVARTVGPSGLADPDGRVRPSHQVSGGQHREDPRPRPRREQRVRPRLRHALRVAREQRSWVNRKSGSACIPAAAAPNASHCWSAAAARSKSFSARTTSTAIPLNDTATSTASLPDSGAGRLRRRARAHGSPPSTDVPSRTAKELINHVSLPSVDRLLDGRNAFATTLTWPETQTPSPGAVQARAAARGGLGESVRRACGDTARHIARKAHAAKEQPARLMCEGQ